MLQSIQTERWDNTRNTSTYTSNEKMKERSIPNNFWFSGDMKNGESVLKAIIKVS